MSTINKKLVGFLYNGDAQTLASASWKTNANAVYSINSAGTGYQVFKPGNTFNSLTQLVPDGVYILDAAKLGFELPGATLTAGPTSDLVAGMSSFVFSSPRAGVVRATFTVVGPAGSVLRVQVADYSTGAPLFDNTYPANQPQTVDTTGVAAGEHRYQVFLEVIRGYGFNSLTSDFTPPAFQVQ
jgi:hypothetical protein